MFEKTILSRDRVQSMAFSVHTCAFRCGFIVVFESTTKPLREAQKYLFERIMCGFSGLLQRFSKGPRKTYYKPADFCTRGRQGPIHSRKTEVWRTHVRQTRRRARVWAKNALNASRPRGHAINLEKRSVWATWVPGVPDWKTAGSGPHQRARAAMTVVWQPNSLKLVLCFYSSFLFYLIFYILFFNLI